MAHAQPPHLRSLERRWFPPVLLLLVVSSLLLSVVPRSVVAHSQRSTSQRSFLPSRPNLYADDMDGDGVDDWILTEDSSVFVTASDLLARGKAYSRVPFVQTEGQGPTQIATVLTGSFLGRAQPRLLCAFAATSTLAADGTPLPRTNVSCALLQTAQYRLEWTVPNQSLPFALRNRAGFDSQPGGVDAFVADLDGDGKDELVIYAYDTGSFTSYSLRRVSKLGGEDAEPFPPASSLFRFEVDAPSGDSGGSGGSGDAATSLAVLDAIPRPASYALALARQQVFAGPLVECACGAAGSQARHCAGQGRNSSVLVPPESIFNPPPLPHSPPRLAEAPARPYALDKSVPRNTFTSDSLLLLDEARGVVQILASCAPTDGSGPVVLRRVLATAAGWLTPGSRLSLASIRGLTDAVDVVVQPPPPAIRPRFFHVLLDGPGTQGLARLAFVYQEQGDLERILRRVAGATAAAQDEQPRMVEMAWMRIQKPRVIQPRSDRDVPAVPILITVAGANSSEPASASAAAGAGAAAPGSTPANPLLVRMRVPTPESTSYYRSDAVVWNPRRALLHFVAATFVSSMPLDRMGGSNAAAHTGHASDAGTAVGHLSVDVDDVGAQRAAASAARVDGGAPSWLGERTFLFSFSQSPLTLRDDIDGDALLTRDELGANMDALAPFGVVSLRAANESVSGEFGSFEPLSALGCSPFRRDVLVEVDYMADAGKSMRPLDGFADPAVADFALHNIALHVLLDDGPGQSIPRVPNLGHADKGGGGFSWYEHIYPLKDRYFTPARRGFFHYALFIDRFNGGSVSGQSVYVPASEFFVSLGGWTNGRGTLTQQQGTFLHELGHNMGLLHGGSDDANWKPNHLSVMNYAFQVGGLRRDGETVLILSDADCDSLDENELDEHAGVTCRVAATSAGRRFSTLVNSQWFDINTPIDFNKNGQMEESVLYDLNGDGAGVLHGSPNEYARMRFDGLNRMQFDFAAAAMGLPQPPDANGKMEGPPNPGEAAAPVDGEDADQENSRHAHAPGERQQAGEQIDRYFDRVHLPEELTFEDAQRQAQQLHKRSQSMESRSWLATLFSWL